MASPDLPSPAVGSLSAQARKLIGSTVAGRYRVLAPIGEGGMGAVYLVEHTVIRKRMALKVLNDEMMKNPEAVARFEREALAAAHIDHANVVAATDSGRTDDGALFVVLEFVDGQALRDRLNGGALPPAMAVHVVRQVVSALVRAHGMGIIHRDLKPENIMLVSRDGDDNMVKVLDFGLAKLSVRALLDGGGATTMGEALTRYGAVFGTPAYMAPEQAAGGEVDGRTDLYALGVLMYEMLTGVLPFDGDDSAALLRQHVAATVPPFRMRVPGLKLPAGLEAMVLKLLEKRPDRRFDSAKALLDAIDTLVNAEGLKYDPSSPAMKLRPESSGRKPAAPVNNKATVVGGEDPLAMGLDEALADPTNVSPLAITDDARLPMEPDAQPGAQGESLALALKDLNALADSGRRPGDPPSLDGLALQFGATPAAGSFAPSLLAKSAGEAGGPPKLRAPSALNIQVLQPEGAAMQVLTPAPPPTFKERVRDAGQEAIGWWRVTGWPTTKRVAQAIWSWLRTYVPIYYGKLLDFIRARLPEKRRGISQTLLGLIVGAVLSVPLILLIVVLARSSGDSSSSATTAPSVALPGFASDRDMERGVKGGVRDLEKLATKYPNDSRVFRALARAHVARKDYAGAIRALTSLARLDPTMASDDEMNQIATAAALLPETSDAAIALLESSLGDKGVSVLSDLAERTTMEPWKGKLNASLQKGTVRAQASEATLILMDLRAAQRCEDKRPLLRRASQQGDARTLEYLRGLQKTTGCGPGLQNDCWTCLRKGTALQAIIDTLSKRLGG